MSTGPISAGGGILSFLRSRPAQILTIFLLIQAAVFYGAVNKGERVPVVRPLSDLPAQMQHWSLAQEGVVEQEVRDVLQADDLLSRSYAAPEFAIPANLFIGYFRSQKTGKSPHSPKNCLPGNGWTQDSAGTETIAIAGGPNITVNRYVVSRGEAKALVVYWYQSRNRVVASEYAAKIYLVLDSIRNHRSDTAIVRVVVPISDDDTEMANRVANSFIQAVFPHVETYFPA